MAGNPTCTSRCVPGCLGKGSAYGAADHSSRADDSLDLPTASGIIDGRQDDGRRCRSCLSDASPWTVGPRNATRISFTRPAVVSFSCSASAPCRLSQSVRRRWLRPAPHGDLRTASLTARFERPWPRSREGDKATNAATLLDAVHKHWSACERASRLETAMRDDGWGSPAERQPTGLTRVRRHATTRYQHV